MNQSPEKHDDDLEKADRIAYLIAGHIQETLSPEERIELDDWVTQSDENLELFEKLTDEDNIDIGIHKYLQAEQFKAQALKGIQEKIRKKRKVKIWSYIAVFSIVVVVTSMYLFRSQSKELKDEVRPLQGSNKNDAAPGNDKAVLTLANGRTIILDSTAPIALATEGDVVINRKAGLVSYSGSSNKENIDHLSVPRGGQYAIQLSDGTKVWLNAESTLKFPESFNGDSREVNLSGEGYFEVAKDANRPFIVTTTLKNGLRQKITVLGTHFNVNAYEDEGKIFTTLQQGSVKVEMEGDTKILKPGEQAIVSRKVDVIDVDANESIAWKEGKFLFHDATIQTISGQIKRWYDVDVEYQGGEVTQHFNLSMPRNLPLSMLLDGLTRTHQVQFHLENRKLIIKP